ncbi:hypothetical protein IW262DRAFT_835088 [Armillaria fumosa]|nr:hypothetical protein IW262DRAFT_835088 [Armillaria fumosa]
MTEIQAVAEEECLAREGLQWQEAFFEKGNLIRFVIAFVISLLQAWSGQNSVKYCAPQIFGSICYTDTRNTLLASGVFGIVKLVSLLLLVFFGIEWPGRKLCLIISTFGMGTLFYIVGVLLKDTPTTRDQFHEYFSIIPRCSQPSYGSHDIHIRILLLFGMGATPMDLRIGYLPDQDKALRLSIGYCISVAVEFRRVENHPRHDQHLGLSLVPR